MLVDYVKLKVIGGSAEALLRDKRLDFKFLTSKSTGEEFENVLTANYRFCTITIYKSQLENHADQIIFSGSIHKLVNDLNQIFAPNYDSKKPYKGFNGNKLTYKNLRKAKRHICRLLQCEATQIVIQNIEFAINGEINTDPKLFTKGLMYHRGVAFEFRYGKNFAEVAHQRYSIKIYNKSEQCGMDTNVLRVELKFNKMIDLRPLGIMTFADLTPEKLLAVHELLLKRLDESVFYDFTIDTTQMSKNEAKYCSMYSNPNYWLETLRPNERDFHKKRLHDLTKRYSANMKHMVWSAIKRCPTMECNI
jgi:hypothetical protein